MMRKLMDRLYSNIAEAKAFQLSFTNFIHMYDDVIENDFTTEPCETCDKAIQIKDYLFPRASCKRPYGILSTLEFGVNEELKNALIERFDVTEDDFRPIRNKKGQIVYYQITPQHVMLPIYKINRWMPYPKCGRCGSQRFSTRDYENEKGEFYHHISSEALEDMHDFNITYERFDFHMPLCVVSRRVYDFLVERYPQAHFTPFFLQK